MATLVDMTKRTDDKKASGRANDRHKPSRQVRIRERFIDTLEALAERNASTVPEEVNRLVREGLERLGLWPAQVA